MIYQIKTIYELDKLWNSGYKDDVIHFKFLYDIREYTITNLLNTHYNHRAIWTQRLQYEDTEWYVKLSYHEIMEIFYGDDPSQ